MKTQTYDAIKFIQTKHGKPLAFFSAPASEIDEWSGVPQKKRFGTGDETAGFQREENPNRIKSLSDFYQNSDNIIQNPLLCATRTSNDVTVEFLPNNEGENEMTCFGKVKITYPDFDAKPLIDIFQSVREYIQKRIPSLSSCEPPQELISELKAQLSIPSNEDSETSKPEANDNNNTPINEDEIASTSSALFEESHIIDFWNEVAARHEVLKEMDEELRPTDELAGFTRSALISYLVPVVLVDGQHRLRGAIESARSMLEDPEVQKEIEDKISKGETPDSVEREIVSRFSRHLPISLLISDEPEEQVFQFVVVNQKATPIGRALLGTIISTTLANEEMEKVAERLKNAGIPLEESQTVTYLSRLPNSPFFKLVERGMAGDNSDLLQWGVFASLISIFRDLKGGNLYGEKNDYASVWRNKFIDRSGIASNYTDYKCENAYQYWRKPDGPWREVFISFWACVRDHFANITDPDKPNYWGRPRSSNLFNKISLTILAADFFQFLVETKKPLSKASDIPEIFNSWIEDVNSGYFDKDWQLTGVKKDSTGIRKRWAEVWVDYRRAGGNLPDRRNYRNPKSD